jgi:hypothetical protein
MRRGTRSFHVMKFQERAALNTEKEGRQMFS